MAEVMASSTMFLTQAFQRESRPHSPPSIMTASTRGPSLPEPNPPFVFPARPAASTSTSDSVSPSALGDAMFPLQLPTLRDSGRTQGRTRKVPEPLPVFDFTNQTSPPYFARSQPASPTRTMPTWKTGGHRRTESELIGGDGTVRGPGMSASPTTGHEAKPASLHPPVSFGPPAGRRGHAHRRSGAISCHDLSLIKEGKASNEAARAGSAPTSPADTDMARHELFMASLNSQDRSATEENKTTMRSEVTTPRARVGFSDTLEFIPRPLSTLSSETSSTLATVRGNHSLSNSISSIASASASSPQAAEVSFVPSPVDQRLPRPNTAGAIMSGLGATTTFFAHSTTPALKRSKSAASSSEHSREPSTSTNGSPKKRGCHRIQPSRSAPILPRVDLGRLLDDSRATTQPTPTDTTIAGPSSVARAPTSVSNSTSGPDAKSERHGGKRPRRVKLWAGSILSRKARHRQHKQKSNARRVATPPTPPAAQPMAETSVLDLDFDDDRICTVVSPTLNEYPRPPWDSNLLDSNAPSPPSLVNASSPMIDLDAALGPFNTPSLGPEFGQASKGGFNAAKRRMHSSGVTGYFSGPGMHYHRRAESAPEMVAFEFGRHSLHRLGSSSTMADVFEEDEEDESSTGPSDADETVDDEVSKSMGVSVVDSDEPTNGLGMVWSTEGPKNAPWNMPAGSGHLGESGRRASCPGTGPELMPSLSETASLARSNSIVEIADDDLPPWAPSFTKSSDSTITPPLSRPPVRIGATPTPMDFVAPSSIPPYLGPDTPSMTNSSFPSPDFARTSFDVPRALTAASSFTDDHVPSSLMMGEPGPELRISVDDVPSLISSSSTMTSAVNYVGPYSVYGDERSRGNRASMSSSALSGPPGARRLVGPKRSSLVSLSRLVGGSHTEKSKLSIEEKAQPETSEKAPKEKRGRRISRLIHFWKAKEVST